MRALSATVSSKRLHDRLKAVTISSYHVVLAAMAIQRC